MVIWLAGAVAVTGGEYTSLTGVGGVAHSRFDRSRQIAAMCYQSGRQTSKRHARRRGLPTAGRPMCHQLSR